MYIVPPAMGLQKVLDPPIKHHATYDFLKYNTPPQELSFPIFRKGGTCSCYQS